MGFKRKKERDDSDTALGFSQTVKMAPNLLTIDPLLKMNILHSCPIVKIFGVKDVTIPLKIEPLLLG